MVAQPTEEVGDRARGATDAEPGHQRESLGIRESRQAHVTYSREVVPPNLPSSASGTSRVLIRMLRAVRCGEGAQEVVGVRLDQGALRATTSSSRSREASKR